ncbi:3'-5' exonuclease [Pseudomonas aeruginosa]|uniref:3'-5' exonuclease n=1 Tax=Pseudomonas aeruginosa TaxID=287 RepID=UPI000F6AD6DB|nr:3'-5' exonuclease [Pseudomonas aeruginosa]MDS9914977.1 3'-5' exonuclease [Pseudomonas aeruginosa]RNF58309.1 3'-5' exonuclease [Pseudomonas aeruginosa]RNF58637.1 3'-5' exonuclease [Pseudomonas aeruginosa]
MSLEHLEVTRAAAVEADKCFSKGRLRDEFRMKPKPGANPVAFYRSGFGGKFGVYRIADCIPLRQKPQDAQPSAKQQLARKIMSVKARMRSKQAQVSAVALGWLNEDGLVLDTETTGLGDEAQIIEIAIGDVHGNILFSSRVSPTVPIEPRAAEIHGIQHEHLVGAPSWPEIEAQVIALLSGRSVVIFNADYDKRLIRQTAAAFGLPDPWPETCVSRCAMYLSADAFGPTNKYGTISLANAALAAGVEWKGVAHSAAADVLATVDVVQSIARLRRSLDSELAGLQLG